ncbi:MAG: hypothetical protein KC546_18630, partial [Anaerolineae bacterium]|nr:hypothetical protein [Anaerolineae bacterium]
YQQLNKDALPVRRVGDADVYSLVGEDSPIDQHITARLTATWVDGSGTTSIEAPQTGEDLFLYITDGAGTAELPQGEVALSQYDVLLARPDMPQIALTSSADKPLRYMSYYLRPFLRL